MGSSCFRDFGTCMGKCAKEGTDTVDTSLCGLDCEVDLIACVAREIRGGGREADVSEIYTIVRNMITGVTPFLGNPATKLFREDSGKQSQK